MILRVKEEYWYGKKNGFFSSVWNDIYFIGEHIIDKNNIPKIKILKGNLRDMEFDIPVIEKIITNFTYKKEGINGNDKNKN